MTRAGRTSASAFLEALIAAVPYKIHTVLTDNPVLSSAERGVQFTFPPRYADGPTAKYMTHMFDMRCQENGIDHRLTKIKHPWTNGQVERMNRTIKDATVKRYHLRNPRPTAPASRRLPRSLQFRSQTEDPEGPHPLRSHLPNLDPRTQRFIANPTQQTPGPNNQGARIKSTRGGKPPISRRFLSPIAGELLPGNPRNVQYVGRARRSERHARYDDQCVPTPC